MKKLKKMNRMKKLILNILIFSLFLGINCQAHTAVVENTGSLKYKSVRLTPEIYNSSNSDLSDILIKDKNGEAVPYFINSQEHITQSNNSFTAKMLCNNSFVKDDYYYFDCKANINTTDTKDIIATVIEFDLKASNKLYKLEIFGGYDGINWENVQADVLYNVNDGLKNRIEFLTPQKYTYYRFKTEKTISSIGVEKENLCSNISIFYNQNLYQTINFAEDISPAFKVVEKDKETIVEIDGITNLKISKIIVETDSMFKRTITSPMNVSKELYNLVFDNYIISDTALNLDGKQWVGDIFELKIRNNDDKPINITGIKVIYFADELVFEGLASSDYTIHFGKDMSARAPIYDIKAYKAEILKGDVDKLTVKDVKLAEEEPQKVDNTDYKLIFNIVIGIVALLLAAMILFKLKGKKGSF